MVAVRRIGARLFSVVGLSIWGALAHQLSQLALASGYIGHSGLFALLPLALFSALVSGGAIGPVGLWTLEQLKKIGWLDQDQ